MYQSHLIILGAFVILHQNIVRWTENTPLRIPNTPGDQGKELIFIFFVINRNEIYVIKLCIYLIKL